MQLSAPIIDNYIRMLKQHNTHFNENSWKLIHKLFNILNAIKPCGENNKHELWITAPRGKITDFGNFKHFIEDELVSNEKEFEEMWKENYPNDFYWYKLTSLSFKQPRSENEFMVIYINNQSIIQTPSIDSNDFEIDISEFVEFLIEAVKNCIDKMKNNTYNDFVKNKLPYELRYGTILRKYYWDIFSEEKKIYLKNLSANEINELSKFIDLQENFQKTEENKYTISKSIGRLSKITANMFYYYCSLGYKENNYSGCNNLSPKELYYKHADGRDEGLKEINDDSSDDFNNWYNDKNRFGGHPWEVCRGGNSTHVSLYVHHDQYGYYLTVDGKSFTRSIEAIKFYLALKRENIPVYLWNGKELLNRVLGLDKIGIVPEFVMPFYCESAFEDKTILDFMHLRIDDNMQILNYIEWFNIEKQYLK